ncbi:Bacterial alpha-L-rhamnosidase [Rubripirellula lacrimiformis]|uniref:alpha-L-rhamnosidase n=1 Tax=Rubripirellula lacrimiformis TaxID=1930273 RepID=A0A517NJN1_9BACT|nr:family 78 glycoside hydrolase catalytic domain [Rubripirellula lacrimiformis]QDT07339.1 Bacterial alpha-L-rhamnosidase [Rubripirellula lacrimiformis]
MRFLLCLPLIATFLILDVSDAQQPSVASEPSQASDAGGEAGFQAMISRGYQPLFNGKDLAGWRNPYPHGEARVVDGEIHLLADDKFFLVTEKKYDDFRLCVDIHLPDGPANSGVMFRCRVDDEAAKKKVYGYQAECDGSDRRWSGGLFDEARRGWIWPSTKGRSRDQFLVHEEESKAAFADPKIANALNRNGWNRFEVTCIGDRIRIEVNGITTVTFHDTTDASGYIGIQHHGEDGQTYRFRNLFIKELPNVPAQETVSIVEQEPISVQKIDDKTMLVDFGKVAFGNIALRVPPLGSGSGKIHFGEKLQDGRIDRHPPGTVRYGVSGFRKGTGEMGTWIIAAAADARNTEQTNPMGVHPPAVLTPKTWLPVMPFRWVEMEGWEGEFKPEYIHRRAAFASDWNDDASSFQCSDPLLNQIWDLCKYSIKATTFAGVYVDGDRERIPYEADAYLNQLSHYATDDNVTMAANSFDWLIENGTWPSEWAPHMVFMAHAQWMYSGDNDWIAQRYELLKSKTLMHRCGKDGLVRSDQMDRRKHDIVDWPPVERDAFVFTEINTVVNAFHIKAIERMAQLARAIGKGDDADAFEAHAKLATASFQEALFDDTQGVYRDGVGTNHSSIHANFLPLAFGIVPANKIAGVTEWLEQQDMRCSPYAAQYFMDGLFRSGSGSGKKAIALMIADGDRSWKHMVNSGTTITWEAWDMKYKPNQDWNHAWGAAPANLFPRYILGAQPTSPGWTTVTIRPCPSGLKQAEGKIPTPRGPILIDWTNDSNFAMSLALPDGMSASVELPATDQSNGVWVNGKSIDATQSGNRWVLKDMVRGTVTVEVR